MKKLFSLLTLALLTMSAWATTYTHTFASGELKTTAGTVTLSGIDWTQTEATAINFSGGATGKGIQIGTGSNPTTNFSLSTNGISGTITKVTVNSSVASGGDATMTVSVGGTQWGETTALVTDATDYPFTGEATGEVKISYAATQKAFYIKSITIEYEGAPISVAAPVFSPNGGTFTESQTVTITCATQDATIKYSTDEQATWKDYTEPLVFNTTTKVYAKGVYGEIESEIVNATFTKVEPAPANTFLPSDYSAVSGVEFSVVKDGVTLSCTQGTINDTQFRFNKNQTVTFKTDEGVADIVKIEFTCTANGAAQYGPGSLALNEGQNGTYTYEENGLMGTWTGKASSISFNTNANQVRATKIVFTLDDGTTITVADPTFTPAACEFEESIDVTINCETEGATIMYALNDGEFQQYNNAITLTQTTTIKAQAFMGEVASSIVTAIYTKKEATEGTMYHFVALTDTLPGYDNPDATTAGAYTITKDRVTFKVSNGSIANYTDNSGNEYHEYRIYKNATIKFSTTHGKIVKIEFLCTSSNPATGFGSVDGMTYDGNNGTWTGNETNVTFTATEKQVRAAEIIVYVVGDDPNIEIAAPVIYPEKNTVFDKTKGLEISISCETEGATIYYSTDGENYSQYEAPFKIYETTTVSAYAQLGELKSETVYSKYNAAIMVYDLDEANGLADGVSFYFQGNAVVTYKNGKNLWVRDASGSGLIFGNSIQSGTFNQGDVLKAGWDAQKKNYGANGYDLFIPEFQYPNNLEVDPTQEAQTVEPTEYTTITVDNVNEYIILKGQTITISGQDMTNADDLLFFDKFGVNPTFEEGKTYDITGIVTIYHDAPEVYIVDVTEAEVAGKPGDVNNDGQVTILDVTVLIDHLLSGDFSEAEDFNPTNADIDGGGISISDVTSLIDILLSM